MAQQDAPAAEVDIDVELVRHLLVDQHADLAELPLDIVAEGWDNTLVRLGDDLVVRLPRRALSAALGRHEQRWLRELSPQLPLPIPAPVRVGNPTSEYPWHWSISPWMEGEEALTCPPDDLVDTARLLATFLNAMHNPAPADAPVNPWRGGPLSDRVESHERFTGVVREAGLLDDPDAANAAFRGAVALPAWNGVAQWVHGDVHPGNLIINDGRLAAVIDFGDITSGDPACDLAVAWMMFDAPSRAEFFDHIDLDAITIARGKGWAIAIGVAVLANSADNPLYAEVFGRAVTEAVADCVF